MSGSTQLRRRRGTAAAGTALALVLGSSVVAASSLLDLAGAPPAAAEYADEGDGLYLGDIDWFDMGEDGVPIPPEGATRTNTREIGPHELATTCTVSNIEGNLATYRSGNYRGDSLDDLYNVGGTGTDNQLVAGIFTADNGGTASFDFDCGVTLDGAPLALGGLVFGDAESSNASQGEYVQATPDQDVNWRVIDRYRECGTSVIASLNAGTVRLHPDGEQCSEFGDLQGPMAVGFMEGATSAHVELQGGGFSAVALGVVLQSDFGDAPASYGEAGVMMEPAWEGGEIPPGDTNVSEGFELGTPSTPVIGLGATVDSDGDYLASDDAAGDDSTGYDATDEDAIEPPGTIAVAPGGEYSVEAECRGPGFVSGWVDWNADGAFDDGEESGTAACTGGSATLTWTVPGDVANSLGSPTFLRLRAGPDEATAGTPTGISLGGEVEDYPLNVETPQRLACDTVWALQGGGGTGDHAIYGVDIATGEMTPVHEMDIGPGSANNNAFGISADGRFAFTHREPNVYAFDTDSETTQEFDGVNNLNATHGAVDPNSGVYYFGNIDGGMAAVYAFDPAAGTFLGQVAEIPLAGAPGANGDWAFDSFGNLYLTAGSTGGSNAVYVARGPLPATAQGTPETVDARRIGSATTTDPINGLAVDVQGFVFLGSADQLFQLNPASGEVVSVQALDPSGQSVDLASCATPATVMVQKDVVDRRNPDDQFRTSVTGGGIPADAEGNAGTTDGTDTGVQDGTAEVGGPLMVPAGETFTVREEPAGTTDLADYTTTWECVNATAGNEVIAGGTGTEGEFTMPVASGSGIGAAVVCTFTNTRIPVPGLQITKSADPSGEVVPGSTVDYTVTVENTGETTYTAEDPATFTDDLTEVLDDATFDDDAVADVGEVTYAEPELTWSGALEPGQTATITYTVTVNDPVTGDGELTNTVVGPPESNCLDGAEEDCTIVVPVRALEIVKTSSHPLAVVPGQTVTYTVEVTNTGQVPYTGLNPAAFDDDLTEVLDDATYNDDAAADVGEVTYADPTLSWSGALDPGEVATITYSVTVDDPPTGAGDGELTNAVVGPDESNCDDGTEDDCTITTPVRELLIVKTATAEEAEPGETVTYTIEVTNSGDFPFGSAFPAWFDDDLTDVLDDATYNGDATADVGEVTFEEPVLHWESALAPGQTATMTYSVTVNDPVSGDGELANVVTGPPVSNCDSDSAGFPADECEAVVPVRALKITKTADPSESVATGGVVSYRVTVTNIGQAPYTTDDPASFTDDLTPILDDATFDDDAAADVGEVTYADPVLSWSGALEPGETATITYSVTVNDPLSGDGVLDNAVVGPDESNCDDGTEEDCHVPVPVRALEVVKTADPSGEVTPGGSVSYTVTVTNTGQAPYTEPDPATVTDDLTGVLDDATFGDDAVVDVGEVTYAEPELSWSGPLEPGQTATITYSVTVNDPLSGDGTLDNAVVGPPESNCDDGTEDGCHVPVPVRALEIVKTSSPVAVQPGGSVSYTVEVTNTGQVPYTELNPATVQDDLSGVLDDAMYNEDAAADVGEVTYAEPILSWSSALAPGETATITYSVTVDDPPTGDGDGELTNAVVGPDESGCDDGTEDDCHTNVPVRELLITKTASAEEAQPGDTVSYTIEVTNVGDFPFGPVFPARFDDDLSGVLDDATYNDDATADVGEVAFEEPTLHWESTLAPGETATITYSVTVIDPLAGDGELSNVVTGPPVSNCDADGVEFPAEQCEAVVPVRALEIVKTSDPAGPVTVGDTLTYSVAVTNIGTAGYPGEDPASATDVMDGVLDDAVYNDDVAADVGEASFQDGEVSWTGPLAAGETATITYSVTVNDPVSGDGTLANAVLGPDESNCPAQLPGGDVVTATRALAAVPEMPEGCQVITPVRAFEVSKTVDVTEADPGDVVTYTVTVDSTGTAPYTEALPAGFSDDLTDVLDDATWDDEVTATAGAASFTEPILTWSGPLEVGGTVTVAYSVTVSEPGFGDGELTNVVFPADGSGGGCTGDGECVTHTDVVPPADPGAPPTPDAGAAPPPDQGVLPVTGAGPIGTILAAALFLTLAGGLLSRGATRLRSWTD